MKVGLNSTSGQRTIQLELISVYVALRWLEIVSSIAILMGRYDHSLSLDAIIMVSKNCPTIGEQVVVIFVNRLP